MTNKERQKSLDKKKWIESEIMGDDMSGNMPWCYHCDYQNVIGCKIPHEERVVSCLCAKAYNKMARK